MPELPDITIYIEALSARVAGRRLQSLELRSPFLLRTVHPAPDVFAGLEVQCFRRIGKRIAIGLEDDHWMVLQSNRLNQAELEDKSQLTHINLSNLRGCCWRRHRY